MSKDTKKALRISVLAVGLVAWLSFIFSNSLKDRIQSANQSEAAEGLLRRLLSSLGISGNTEAIAEIAVRKAAHIFEFFVLALLFLLLFSALTKGTRTVVVYSMAFSVLCACVDELLQTVSHRGASVKDVFIDAVGIALCIGLYYLYLKKRKKQN